MKRASLVRSTGIVAFSTLLSRILGFVRDMLTAKYFGASGSLDAFFVAFRIPNLFRRLVAEGALTVSFIPVYSDYLVNRGENEALQLAQKTLTILLVILSFLVTLGILFSPEIVRVIALGFSHPEKIEMTVALNRIMFPYLFFVSIVAFAMGVLNSHDYFFAPAFSPVLLNVGIIAGILVLSASFSEPLYGMALGVLLGGILQLLLQVPYLVRSGFKLKLSLDLRHPGIRKIFSLVVPTLFGFAIYQINILMSTLLASFLPEGSISYLYYSDRLTEMVLGIFIVSIGNVILPAMSRISASNDMESLKSLYGTSMSAALFLAIPASAALMTAGLPIVSVLFMRDQFTPLHAVMTERALFFASMGIASIALLRITTPTFYSLKDTRIPVISSFISFVLNITLGYILMHTSLRHAGLSLANTISSTVQVIFLLAFLKRKIGGMGGGELWKSTAKFITAAAVMSLVIYALSSRADWLRDGLLKRLTVLAMMVAAGGLTYFAACAALGVPELSYLARKLRGLRK
jgi:putative peptidoglycan lipid II flippase